MKGWIKVHEASDNDEVVLNVGYITSVQIDDGGSTIINGVQEVIYASETMTEVLALIEKAEGEEAPKKKRIDPLEFVKACADTALREYEERGVVDFVGAVEDFPGFDEETYVRGIYEGIKRAKRWIDFIKPADTKEEYR